MSDILKEANRKRLNCYTNGLKGKTYSVDCPTCGISILPQKFESHYREVHGLNPSLCCVWCLGKVKWARGKKQYYSDHLLSCSRKVLSLFLAASHAATVTTTAAAAAAVTNREVDENPSTSFEDSSSTTTTTTTTNLRLLNLEPCCEDRSFFDCQDISRLLPPAAFDQFCILKDHGKGVDYFRDENLNAAASYVRLFVETKDSSDWMHVMVRAFVFEKFARAVVEDEENTKILPFSCWCDGGRTDDKPIERQHRHMIVVSRLKNNHFKSRVWKKIVSSDRPYASFKIKTMQVIESPMHLVNTLGYVCRRESRCKFTFDTDTTTTTTSAANTTRQRTLTNKHFYIFKTLPVDYRLPLCVQWDGGIERLLYQEKFQNVSITRLIVGGKLIFEDGKYRQKIKDFYGFERGKVLPLRKEFGPPTSNVTTNRFCYLTKGQKFYFDRFSHYESLDDDAWLKKQAEGGNCFYDNVGEDTWVSRKRDQENLSIVMPLVREYGDLKRKHEREMAGLKEELGGLKSEYERKMARLKEELDGLKLEYDAAVNGLNENREENERLRTQLGKLRHEIATLKRNISIISHNNITLNMST